MTPNRGMGPPVRRFLSNYFDLLLLLPVFEYVIYCVNLTTFSQCMIERVHDVTLLRTLCASVYVGGDQHHHHDHQQMMSSLNCSRLDSMTGERVAVLSLRCHGDDDVISVTSLCAGYLARSRDDCHGCCVDEMNDCRVAVDPTHYSLMSLTATCDGRQTCNMQLYQPSVKHCIHQSDIHSNYVIVIYRCIPPPPPITAGLYTYTSSNHWTDLHSAELVKKVVGLLLTFDEKIINNTKTFDSRRRRID